MYFLSLENQPYEFLMVDSTFERVLQPHEVMDYVTPYAYNGPLVRLEDVVGGNPTVLKFSSEIGFFDLLSTNLAGGERFNKSKVLGNPSLANALAVSLVLEYDGKVVITKRSSRVAVGKHLFGVSVTGSVEPSDLSSQNPILKACERETLEELGGTLVDFQLNGIFIGDVKKQPVALCRASLVEPIEVLDDYFFEENQKLLYVDPSRLHLFSSGMSEAAQFHLNHLYSLAD